jgi:hypothetical protein
MDDILGHKSPRSTITRSELGYTVIVCFAFGVVVGFILGVLF